jgi:hypothetical protein
MMLLMYAFTGQSEEFGISTKGIYNVLSPHCIVFDQQISRNWRGSKTVFFA